MHNDLTSHGRETNCQKLRSLTGVRIGFAIMGGFFLCLPLVLRLMGKEEPTVNGVMLAISVICYIAIFSLGNRRAILDAKNSIEGKLRQREDGEGVSPLDYRKQP